ncbi:MAG: ABC transporter ATP-binding protein [Isosphaeraceae bacterium]
MSRSIIVCDRLSKRYHLGVHRGKGAMSGAPPSLRETISGKLRDTRDLLTRTRREKKPADNVFWALKDVSFEVGRGEVVGIVGRNGAGKSTLLKILSRIVEPTGGTARLRGRVASLLEVGTGFHPELSGRENIYLNGAILGMRKFEIDRKFDEIVAFSEIEEFLDTPVKRYSSGMYVRLAFAVAAHLEPEILIVDEVLAVGDYAFQRKCLGKMQDVATGDGRTILFVSHNMAALAQLCGRGILLEHGTVSTVGSIRDVIEDYLQSGSDHRTALAEFPVDPSKPCQFVSAAILRGDGGLGTDFSCEEPFTIRLQFEVRQAVPGLKMWFTLLNLEGIRVFCSDVRDGDPSITERLGIGRHTFEITVPGQLLAPMTYLMNIGCFGQAGELLDFRESCCEFTLRDLVSQRPDRPGFLSVLLPWEHHQAPRPEPSRPHERVATAGAGSVADNVPSAQGDVCQSPVVTVRGHDLSSSLARVLRHAVPPLSMPTNRDTRSAEGSPS